jgi:hypothetical protein
VSDCPRNSLIIALPHADLAVTDLVLALGNSGDIHSLLPMML